MNQRPAPAENDQPPGDAVRALMRRSGQATLATLLRRTPEAPQSGAAGGSEATWPYASLVLVALDHDASPLLLISDLADHSKNIKADAHVSLLFDGTAGYRDPLAGPRATVIGEIQPCDGDERLLARFLKRHPGAELYAGFKDFRFYRVALERAHLVAGFGRIFWIEAPKVLIETTQAAALAQDEADILAHMNKDHGDAVALIAKEILGLDGEGWTMTGVDPEGADFRAGKKIGRLDFDQAITDAEGCRTALVAASKEARARAAG